MNSDIALQPATSTVGELPRSWPFRLSDAISRCTSILFGVVSLIFLLAVVANIPILQVLSFGYLLEVTGRLARRQPLRDSFVGLSKAARIGAILLGSWLLLLPIRMLSTIWLDAYLIDPTSPQQSFLRAVEFVLILLVVAHIFCAVLCGGKLRYFFWPVVAPLSFLLWLVRRLARRPFCRHLLDLTVGRVSPRLVNDICRAQPVRDWFLPAIVWSRVRSGGWFAEARDRLWCFVVGLRVQHYAVLGAKGFLGTALWLLVPTWLLISATAGDGPLAALAGVCGSLVAVPVFSLLPFMQAHFAVDGKLGRFLECRAVLKNMGRAPLMHWFALLLTLLLALPLFLLKVERIPDDLMWSLSVFFVVFIWPAKWLTGWAYRRGAMGSQPRRWWIRYPIWGLLLATSFLFVLLMFFTRYITWNGAASLLENHVFLLPAPFWLW